MSPSRARVGVSADAFVAVVRAYADRVHDDVRRLGCTPAEAAEVVETSALNLAERLRVRPHEVPDLVGTWFRDARLYAERVASGGADPDEVVESGEGIVQASEEDATARRALVELNERDRMALLLRDAYDLPYASTAVALGAEPAAVGAVVARARLRFLRFATGEGPDEPAAGHDAELATTARLADGSLPPDEAGGAERHVAKCAYCAPLLAPLREARRLLSGLAILAMPDADRDGLITRATAVAGRVLPSAEEVATAADDTGPSHLLPISLVAACVAGAIALGALVAFGTTDDSSGPTAVPTLSEDPFSPSPSSLTPTPTPTPTTATPTPTSTPTPTRTASPTPSRTASPTPTTTFVVGREAITINPTTGPNGTEVTVTGTGWRPGATVTLSYFGPLGDTGQRGSAVVGPDGRFSGKIAAYDDERIPGFHTIRARAGSQSAEATFTAT